MAGEAVGSEFVFPEIQWRGQRVALKRRDRVALESDLVAYQAYLEREEDADEGIGLFRGSRQLDLREMCIPAMSLAAEVIPLVCSRWRPDAVWNIVRKVPAELGSGREGIDVEELVRLMGEGPYTRWNRPSIYLGWRALDLKWEPQPAWSRLRLDEMPRVAVGEWQCWLNSKEPEVILSLASG